VARRLGETGVPQAFRTIHALGLRAEAHRRLERRATNCTYRKSEEIGPAWILSSLEGLLGSAGSHEPMARW
jgi:hypothetical protein